MATRRTLVNSPTLTWDFTIAGQVKGNAPGTAFEARLAALEASTATTFDYEQNSDPGAIGQFKTWLQESTGLLFVRNRANTGWISITGTPAPSESVVAMPAITFDEDGLVTLETTTTDASIYYTIDGSTPTISSTLYSIPFLVANGTNVKAIGIRSGFASSIVASAIVDLDPPDTLIVNLGSTGLVFDGTTDQSAAFQAIIDAAAPGTEFRFPVSGTLRIKNILINDRSFLTFVGAGTSVNSIIWNGTDNQPIITHNRCSNITYRDISIINRHVLRFGGIRHFTCHNFTYDNCKIWDDDPVAQTTNEDRYAIVFGFAGAANFSTNIVITNCVFDHLQVEVDSYRGYTCTDNVFSNNHATATMGMWAHGSFSIQEDALIEGNTFNSPVRATLGAITLAHDAGGLSFVSFQRIRIINNIINHTTPGLPVAPGITCQVPVSGVTSGNIYKDITIEDNTLIFADGSFLGDPRGAISFFGNASSGVTYDNMVVKNNIIQVNQFTSGSQGIHGRLVINSTFDGNVITNCHRGFHITNGISNVTFINNEVFNALTAYSLGNVVGGVTLDTTNTYTNSDVPIALSNIGGVNVITGPVEATSQRGSPASTTTLGDWTDEAEGTTNIHTKIDETPAVDTDYVQSEDSPQASPYVVALSAVTDPESSFGHTVNYRYRKNFDAGETIDLTVQLREGYTNEGAPGTLIASNFHGDIDGINWANGSISLSEAEADSITDYSDLFLRFVADIP